MRGLVLQTPPTHCPTSQLAFPHTRELSHNSLSPILSLQAHPTDFILKLFFISLIQVKEAPLAISKTPQDHSVLYRLYHYPSFQHVHKGKLFCFWSIMSFTSTKKALSRGTGQQQHSCNQACKANTKKAALAQQCRDAAHQHRAV